MQTLESLKSQLERLRSTKIRLSTQIENLVQQENVQRQKLASLGVADVDGALASFSTEAAGLQNMIEKGFSGCGV